MARVILPGTEAENKKAVTAGSNKTAEVKQAVTMTAPVVNAPKKWESGTYQAPDLKKNAPADLTFQKFQEEKKNRGGSYSVKDYIVENMITSTKRRQTQEGFQTWLDDMSSFAPEFNSAAVSRQCGYQNLDSFRQYQTNANKQISYLLAEGDYYKQYFKEYGGMYDALYNSPGMSAGILKGIDEYCGVLKGARSYLKGEENHWASFSNERDWRVKTGQDTSESVQKQINALYSQIEAAEKAAKTAYQRPERNAAEIEDAQSRLNDLVREQKRLERYKNYIDDYNKSAQEYDALTEKWIDSAQGDPHFAEWSKYRSTANGEKPKYYTVGTFNPYAGFAGGPALTNVGSVASESGYGDLEYEYINGVDQKAVSQYRSDQLNLGNQDYMAFLQEMTPEEKKAYNFWKEYDKTNKTEKTKEFLKDIETTLTARRTAKEAERWAAMAREDPLGTSIFSILESPFKVATAVGQVADYVDDGKIDTNAGYNKYARINSSIRSEVSQMAEENFGPVGSGAYNIAMSIADSMVTRGLDSVIPGLGLFVMGTGAGADTVISCKERGLSDDQSIWLGAIAGAVEIITEKWSLDKFFEIDSSDGFWQVLLKAGIPEAQEEGAANIADFFADIIISQDRSEWQRSIDEYMANGMAETEAVGRAFADQAVSLGSDMLAGFISGALSGGSRKLFNTLLETADAKYRKSQRDSYMQIVQEMEKSGKENDVTYENQRLTEEDLEEYLHVGLREHVRNEKARQIQEGQLPILTKASEIKSFIADAIKGKIRNVIKAYGKVGTRMYEDVLSVSRGSVNIEGYYLELDANSIGHLSDHVETDDDIRNIPLTMEQAESLTDYIDGYDDIIEVKKHRDGAVRLILGKKINGHSIIVEAVSKGRSSLHPVTAFQVSSEDYERKYKSRLHADESNRRVIGGSPDQGPISSAPSSLDQDQWTSQDDLASDSVPYGEEKHNINGETNQGSVNREGGRIETGSSITDFETDHKLKLAGGTGNEIQLQGQNGQESDRAGAAESGRESGGDREEISLLSSERGNDQRAGGSDGQVRGALRTDGADQRELRDRRKASVSGERYRDGRECGIPGTVEGLRGNKPYTVQEWDTEAKEAISLAKENGIRNVTLVTGAIQIERGGKACPAAAVIDIRTGTLYAQADPVGSSLLENVRHELGHEKATADQVRRFGQFLRQQEEYDELMEMYRDVYRGLTNGYRDMTDQEIAAYLTEEALCDSYAGMTRLGHDMSAYRQEAEEILNGRDNRLTLPGNESDAVQSTAPEDARVTRGPPENSGRMTLPTAEDMRFSVKHPHYSEEALRRNASRLETMEAVDELSGNEFAKGSVSLRQQVLDFFKSLGNTVYSDEFGDVALTLSSWRSEQRHGLTNTKAVTFAAVPSVIRKGVVIDERSYGANAHERIVVAAPITIGGEKYYVGVMLQRRNDDQRLYLHDVVAEKSQDRLNQTQTGLYVKDNRVSWSSNDLDMSTILLRAINNNQEKQEDGGALSGTDVKENPKNAKYSAAGPGAMTADLEQLGRALEMELEGRTPEEIFRETNWYRGAEGKWRFEIDDSPMEYRHGADAAYLQDPDYREYLEMWNRMVTDGEEPRQSSRRLRELSRRYEEVSREIREKVESGKATLADFIEHDGLFEAYPQLRDVGVEFMELEDGVYGQYLPFYNTIVLSEELRYAPEEVLLHEIQHVIQRYEGFSPGATAGYWESRQGKSKQDAAELYRNTAGEAEARDTAGRRTLTAEQRRETMPFTGDENTVFADPEAERYPADAQEDGSKTRIIPGMSEEERTEILRRKTISAPIYAGQANSLISENREALKKAKGELARDTVQKVAEQFGALSGNEPKYDFSDIQTEVFFSVGSLNESMHSSITDASYLAKLMPVLKEAVSGAVGLEVHDNRYFSDNTTLQFYELLGGYIDGDYFIPVRFGVKSMKDGSSSLYVVICQDKIEETGVMETEASYHDTLAPGSRSVSGINIAKAAENVNSEDLLRYLPDGLLNERQRKIKYRAIADTVEYTNNKNDAAYLKALERGDIRTMQRMVEAAARAAGYSDSALKSTEPITYDDDGNVIPISKRFDRKNPDIRFSAAQENREEILQNLRGYLDAGDLSGLRSYTRGLSDGNTSTTRQAQLRTYGETQAQKIVDAAHGRNMGVEEYLRENWEQFDEDGRWSKEAQDAIKLEREQMRMSAEEDEGQSDAGTDELQKEIDEHKQKIRELRKLQNKDKPRPTRKEKREQKRNKPSIARKDFRTDILNLFSIPEGKKKKLGEIVNRIADEVYSKGRIETSDRQRLFDALYDEGIMQIAAEQELQDNRQLVLENARKIYVSPEIREEFGDEWGDTVRRAFAAGIYLTGNNSDRGIDAIRSDLEYEGGNLHLFRGVSETDPKGSIERLIETAESGKAMGMSLGEFAQYLEGEGYGAAEEFQENLERQVDYALQMYAQKAGLEVSLKDRADRKADEERQKRKEANERQQERKQLADMQQKTLKQLQWISRNKQKLGPDVQKRASEILGNFDLFAVSAAKETNWSKKYQATWKDLKDIYLEAKENDPNWLPTPYLEKIVARLDNDKIADLDPGALNDLYQAAVGLRNEYYNRNRMLGDMEDDAISEIYDGVKDEFAAAHGGYQTGAKGAFSKFFNLREMTPDNVLRMMGGWKQDGKFSSMAAMLVKGERDMRNFKVRSERMLEGFIRENKDWIRKADGQGKNAIWYEVEVPELLELGMGDKPIFGKTVKVYMTPSQKVHLYLESKNQDNLRHMLGGRTFVNKELYQKGKRREALAQGTTVRLAPETVKQLVSDLTEEEKALAKVLSSCYNDFSKREINRVSNILCGFDKAISSAEYAPIFTNANYNKTEIGVFDLTAEGVGNLKSRQQYAKNPSYNISCFDAFERSVEQTSRYVGMAVPARNWNTLLNWREQNNSMGDVITHKYGEEGKRYITDLLERLQSGEGYEETGFVEKLTSKLLSRNILATFGHNAAIVLKQAASFPQFAAALGWKNIKLGKVNEDLMNIYTSELAYRKLGYATPETAVLKNNPGKLRSNKVYNFFLGDGAITAMDAATVKRAWSWAENKVRKEQPNLEVGTGSEIMAGESDFYKAVAKEWEEAVSLTQPMYDEMHRAGIMKEKGIITRAVTLFKTVPLQQYNSLRRAFGEYRAALEEAKAGDEAAKEKAKAAGRKAADTVIATIASHLMVEAVEFLTQLWKNRGKGYRDDDGELTAESIIQKICWNLLGDAAGMVTLGSELSDILESVVTGSKWYGIEIPGEEQLDDVIESIKSTAMTIEEFVVDMADLVSNGGDLPGYMKRNGGKYAKAALEITEKLSMNLSGFPAGNIRKYLMGSLPDEIQQHLDAVFGGTTKTDLKTLSGDALTARAETLFEIRGVEMEEDTLKELTRLYSGKNSNAMPSDTPTTLTVDGEKISLSASQRQKYDKAWEKAVGKELDTLVADEFFNASDDEQKSRMVAKVFQYANAKGKSGITGEELEPEFQKAEELVKAGGSVSDWASWNVWTSEMEGEEKYGTLEKTDYSDPVKAAIYKQLAGKTSEDYELLETFEKQDTDIGEAYRVLNGIHNRKYSKELDSNDCREILIQSKLSERDVKAIYTRKFLTSGSDRETLFYDLTDAGMKPRDFLKIQNRYNELNSEMDKSSQKTVEFANWIDNQGYTQKQVSLIREGFKYWSMMAGKTKYDTFTEAGLGTEAAYKLTTALNDLKPEEGRNQVSDLQKWRVIVDSGISEKEQFLALEEVCNESQIRKFTIASSGGFSPRSYVTVFSVLPQFDADGNGSYKNAEIEAALDSFGTGSGKIVLPRAGEEKITLTNDQKAVMWQLLTGSTSAKNNPYSTDIGGMVIGEVQKAKENSQKETGTGTKGTGTVSFGGIVLPKA